MKHKPKCPDAFVLWAILAICAGPLSAKPLDYEDVAGLLPEEPQNNNDTMAAIVQDPVVKDAVHSAASNGSLNGLVVKKHVFIMPASDPAKVLSHREQVLVVPSEHLEDVRKNITDARQAELDGYDFASAENQSSFEDNIDESTSEKTENESEFVSNERRFSEGSYEDSENSILKNDDRNGEIEFPEVLASEKSLLPQDTQAKISLPIVAVIKPPNSVDDKIETSIVAIIPNRVQDQALINQLDYFKDNSDKIEAQAQAYVDRSSIAIDPESWKFYSTSPEITGTLETHREDISTSPLEGQEKLLLTPVVLPNLELAQPIYPPASGHLMFPREADDMDVAEDIIFRPLFRYRQEAQERSRYRERENNYRRSSYQRYNPYQSYDSYPRRNYRYKPRYYDDYE